AGTGKRHCPAFAVVVRDGCERSDIEADDLVVIEPRNQLVFFRFHRRSVEIAEHIARMLPAAPVAGELHDREAGRFGAAGGQDFPLVPLETPEGRADAVAARINRNVLDEIRTERLVLVAEKADRGSVTKGAHSLVSPFVKMIL